MRPADGCLFVFCGGRAALRNQFYHNTHKNDKSGRADQRIDEVHQLVQRDHRRHGHAQHRRNHDDNRLLLRAVLRKAAADRPQVARDRREHAEQNHDGKRQRQRREHVLDRGQHGDLRAGLRDIIHVEDDGEEHHAQA